MQKRYKYVKAKHSTSLHVRWYAVPVDWFVKPDDILLTSTDTDSDGVNNVDTVHTRIRQFKAAYVVEIQEGPPPVRVTGVPIAFLPQRFVKEAVQEGYNFRNADKLRAELMAKMRTRAEEISKDTALEQYKRIAHSDPDMAALVEQYEAIQT